MTSIATRRNALVGWVALHILRRKMAPPKKKPWKKGAVVVGVVGAAGALAFWRTRPDKGSWDWTEADRPGEPGAKPAEPVASSPPTGG